MEKFFGMGQDNSSEKKEGDKDSDKKSPKKEPAYDMTSVVRHFLSARLFCNSLYKPIILFNSLIALFFDFSISLFLRWLPAH